MRRRSIAARADLWPHDAAAQVEVQRWLSWDAAHFTRHGATLYFEHVIKPAIGLYVLSAACVAVLLGCLIPARRLVQPSLQHAGSQGPPRQPQY